MDTQRFLLMLTSILNSWIYNKIRLVYLFELHCVLFRCTKFPISRMGAVVALLDLVQLVLERICWWGNGYLSGQFISILWYLKKLILCCQFATISFRIWPLIPILGEPLSYSSTQFTLFITFSILLSCMRWPFFRLTPSDVLKTLILR